MSKPARGTKRVCASCDARFYDLGRSPIICPVCGAVYQVATTMRRGAAAATVKPAPETQTEEDDKPAVADAEVISHQLIEEVTPQMFSDATHLGRYVGDIPYTEYLVEQYAERLAD